MANLINEQNLGAWLLRCNPTTWDLPRYIADGNSRIPSWSMRPGYRSRMMAPGDRVVMWVTGTSMTRGLWGSGHVTEATHDALARDSEDYEYWLDKSAADAVEYMVGLDLHIWPAPVSAVEIANAGMTDLEIYVIPNGPNPSWISVDQLERLQPLLPDWPDDAGETVITVYDGRGAGFGTAEQNRRVEMAAMDEVRSRYESVGWHVEDVSAKKLGWDLTASREGSADVEIEVKGVSSDRPTVLLTANEIRAAEERPTWQLVVVTRALSLRQVHTFTAEQALDAARAYVYRAELSPNAR